MNQQPVQLSILLTTHIPLPVLEQLLGSLGNIEKPAAEIIIIDDTAPAETNRAITELVKIARNEQIFLYDHERPVGRGNSLNEAIAQATGKFIWAPVKASRFNETLLQDAIRRFSGDTAAFWVMDYQLPEHPEQWFEHATDGRLPNDSCFIWNRAAIDPEKLFFNPFMRNLHAAELAIRLHNQNAWRRTDPFFVIGDDHFVPASASDLQELSFSLYRTASDPDVRKMLAGKIGELQTGAESEKVITGLPQQARIFLEQGDPNRALDAINRYLKKDPSNEEALLLKISSLERMRRHVEASELKHSLKNREPLPPEQVEMFLEEQEQSSPAKNPDDVKLSIVIPTTGHGRRLLENCLHELQNHPDPDETELIIIDNASIDDTFEYLQQLHEKNFLNMRVITNKANRGFGASVNMGLEAAHGDHVLVMHTDLLLSGNTIPALTEALQESDQTVMAVPLLNQTDSDEQHAESNTDSGTRKIYSADSCCFMMKKDIPVRFDEGYGIAFYEMDDFCRQIESESYEIVVACDTVAEHSDNSLSRRMGLKLVPELRWKNRALFTGKWEKRSDFTIPAQGKPADRLEVLGPPINPEEPEQEWLDAVDKFLTDEVKTEILRSDLSENELITIVSTAMMADQRELMRTLEDRLDDIELPLPMLVLLIHYYFRKNIYSRCRHYLDKAGNMHPVFDMYRLRIAIADKETDKAGGLLKNLLDDYPSSPDLLALAGSLYRQLGDEDEAKSFLAMANQLDPNRFPKEETAFEIKY